MIYLRCCLASPVEGSVSLCTSRLVTLLTDDVDVARLVVFVEGEVVIEVAMVEVVAVEVVVVVGVVVVVLVVAVVVVVTVVLVVLVVVVVVSGRS